MMRYPNFYLQRYIDAEETEWFLLFDPDSEIVSYYDNEDRAIEALERINTLAEEVLV
jgi:hypothetical protein